MCFTNICSDDHFYEHFYSRKKALLSRIISGIHLGANYFSIGFPKFESLPVN